MLGRRAQDSTRSNPPNKAASPFPSAINIDAKSTDEECLSLARCIRTLRVIGPDSHKASLQVTMLF